MVLSVNIVCVFGGLSIISTHLKKFGGLPYAGFSLHRPTGLIQSLSRDVRHCVCVPLHDIFVKGLLLSASLPENGGFQLGDLVTW